MGGRAIGIIRVSHKGDRNGDSFISPQAQRDRIRDWCHRDGVNLLELHDEIDVSGGTPLAKRKGLSRAVQAAEAGEADMIVVAYFDRLVRSLRVQDEVVSRVEAAGGRVLALDFGRVTHETAAQWLSGTMIGAVSEYYRRSGKERSGEGQARAVARGVAPWPHITPGYLRGPDGVLVPDQEKSSVVEEAFEMRAEGATIAEVRAFLATNGIGLSYHGVQHLLTSKVVLGEIHFGKLVNLDAHEAIVDRNTWRRVQKTRVSRGRRAKSDRLLARLGVLRCGTCDARMIVGTSNHGRWNLYRCPPVGDCPRRVTIGAEIVEGVVTERVRTVLANVEGRASVERQAREAETAAEHAQADLGAAIRAFAGLEGEAAATERMTELREVRDRAVERAEHLGGLGARRLVRAGADWDRLSLDARRALVKAVVARATVSPGRSTGRGHSTERVSVALHPAIEVLGE